MIPKAPVTNPSPWLLNTWRTCSEKLHKLRLAPQRPEIAHHGADHTVAGLSEGFADVDEIQEALWARADASQPVSRLEQLTLDDLIEDALILGVIHRIAWNGERYEVTAAGERYTLTPRQALAFLAGAVEAHRACWRFGAVGRN